jgi:hypothetical protein
MTRPWIGLLVASFVTVAACAAQGPVGEDGALYFSDCQEGAAPDCVPGANGNPGTKAKPKRDFSSIDLNDLAAGQRLLLKRGGAWSMRMIRLENPNVTVKAPLVIDAWGEGKPPLWRAVGFNGVEFGGHRPAPEPMGGYTLRNLKIDGLGSSGWGLFLRGSVRAVTLEDVEITGFKIAIHSQNQGSAVNSGVTLRRVNVNRNSEMGMLGDADDLLIEDSRFEANNYSGSNFNHGIYLGGRGRNAVVRNTVFVRNSVVNGQCTGGNLTVHGQWDGLVIENNTVLQDAAVGTCYGLVVNGGYSSQEWFRKLVVRGNRIVNVGGCGICLTSAPQAVVESNVVINDQATYQVGVLIPSSPYDGGDAPDEGAVVRNNVVCFSRPGEGSSAARVKGANASESGTVYLTGAAASKGACTR